MTKIGTVILVADIRIFRGEALIASTREAHIAMLASEPVGIWIPKLVLNHEVVRGLIAQQFTPFKHFMGAELRGVDNMSRISMVWGDFALYETGMPLIVDFYAIPKILTGLPDPATVATAVARLKEMKERHASIAAGGSGSRDVQGRDPGSQPTS